MFRKVLVAAAILIASPSVVSAQDIFWSFDSGSAVDSAVGLPNTSGTAYIFSDGLFGFDAIDLNFSSSNTSALLFTGGTTFNPTFNAVGGMRFDSSVITIDPNGDTGNLFAVNVAQNGVNPALGPLFDPGFDANVGPNGAFLLAEVDFELFGGTATLDFSLGDQGALQLPSIILDPTFGSATHTGTGDDGCIPEPSSLALLMLGSVGLVGRRKRS